MSWEKLSFTVENKMGNLYKLEIVILNLTLTRHLIQFLSNQNSSLRKLDSNFLMF